MAQADLTAHEVLKALDELKAQGRRNQAFANASLVNGVKPYHVSFYPEGTVAGERLYASGPTWREAVTGLQADWVKRSANRSAKLIRKMALAIITLTADQGECTDAALRAEFSASDIEAYGADACAQASDMANNGPFNIVALKGANAA